MLQQIRKQNEPCRHRPSIKALQQLPFEVPVIFGKGRAAEQKRNVLIYYCFSFLTGFYIATGTTVLFERQLGLSFSQIFTLDAIYMLMFILFEIPSGALADLLGRKKTLLAGLAILTVAAIATGNAQNFLHLLLSFFTWALGFSLISGSSDAMLYDSLRDEKLYHRISGRALFFSTIGLAAAGVVGPLLFARHFRLPYLLSAFPFAAALFVMAFYREPTTATRQKFSLKSHVKQIRLGAEKAFSSRFILWSTGALALVFTVSYTFASSYQPYLTQIGFTVSQFAFILPLLFVIEAFGGGGSEKITSLVGETAAFWGGIIAIGVSLLCLGFFASKSAIPLLLFYGFLQGFARPLVNTYANRYIESDLRATIISVQMMVSTVAASALLFLFGFLTDRIGVIALTGVTGGLVLLAGLPLLLLKPQRKRGQR
jgi:MFS family permease